MPIFVTEEITEDPRVVEFREKNHEEYDGLVLRTDLPRGSIPLIGVPTPMHTYPSYLILCPNVKSVLD